MLFRVSLLVVVLLPGDSLDNRFIFLFYVENDTRCRKGLFISFFKMFWWDLNRSAKETRLIQAGMYARVEHNFFFESLWKKERWVGKYGVIVCAIVCECGHSWHMVASILLAGWTWIWRRKRCKGKTVGNYWRYFKACCIHWKILSRSTPVHFLPRCCIMDEITDSVSE